MESVSHVEKTNKKNPNKQTIKQAIKINPFLLQIHGTHANRKNGTVYESGFHQDFDKRVRVKFNFTLVTG